MCRFVANLPGYIIYIFQIFSRLLKVGQIIAKTYGYTAFSALTLLVGCQEGRSARKNLTDEVLVPFSLLDFGLHCFDAVGWVSGRASGP